MEKFASHSGNGKIFLEKFDNFPRFVVVATRAKNEMFTKSKNFNFCCIFILKNETDQKEHRDKCPFTRLCVVKRLQVFGTPGLDKADPAWPAIRLVSWKNGRRVY